MLVKSLQYTYALQNINRRLNDVTINNLVGHYKISKR